jgi:hypothetical protein
MQKRAGDRCCFNVLTAKIVVQTITITLPIRSTIRKAAAHVLWANSSVDESQARGKLMKNRAISRQVM